MKMRLYLLALIVACLGSLKSAHAQGCCETATLELRASYFRPFSDTLKKMFHSGGVNYSLETTIPIWSKLNFWGAVDYFSKEGKMVGIDRSAHLTLVPITLGLKGVFPCNQYYGIYGGAGARYYFIEMVNRMYPIYRTTHTRGLGGVFEFGNFICINKRIFIDLFVNWSFKKTHHGPSDLPSNFTALPMQVGGWNVGGGIGYKF